MTEATLLGIWQLFALLVGLTLGSFCNVCIDRMPHDRSLLPRSSCDSCGHAVRPVDLVPLLSYAWLRGRCRDCGAAIGLHIPLVELLVGLLSVLLWRRFVPGAGSIDAAHLAAWAYYLGFVCLLVVASYVDIRHRIIPDETSIYAVPLGVGGLALLGWLGYDGWLSLNWRAGVAGALFAGGFFAVAALFARAARGADALGWGDVKLVAMIGAFLGPLPGAMLVMMIGSVLGAVVGIVAVIVLRARAWLPFGPALAIAAVAYLLYADVLVGLLMPGMGYLLTGRG